MTGTTAQRWRTLSDQLSARIEAVPADAWDNPSPCEGWVARDVVRHLADWMPALYLGSIGLPLPGGPSADIDPAGTWAAADKAIQGVLDDPELSQRMTDSPAGQMTVEQLIEFTGLMDLLIHAWDLARATGQDETLDPDEVHVFAAGIQPEMSEVMVASGHYKPSVHLPADADEQSRLLAFTGRQP
ncbi:MAG: TIGR03086 family metal-binding protein [Candidatus Nanopelagicales bacterium]